MTSVLPRGSRATYKVPTQGGAPATLDTALTDTALNDAPLDDVALDDAALGGAGVNGAEVEGSSIDDLDLELVLDGALLPEAPVSPAGPARPESPADAAQLGQRQAGVVLTERQKAMLAFERSWWRRAGSKEQAIKEQFKLSATRYYQLLNQLLELPEALAYDPVVVRRLRRLRATRARSRRAA